MITIHGALKSNWDFVRMCMGVPAFGSTTNAFIASNVAGTAEGVIPVFHFLALMPPYGLKLDAGSQQKLTLRVNDDTSVIGTPGGFDAIAYGFDRFE